MSKKHFELVARTIQARVNHNREQLESAEHDVHACLMFQSKIVELNRLAFDFAVGFEGENPRFDRGRFFKACGFESEHLDALKRAR